MTFDYFRVRQKVSALLAPGPRWTWRKKRAVASAIREWRPVSLGEKGLAEL